jgi:alkanesulfonate monooxygenase SsuD/methylene tetrahydromethanopterin reductase-like flavin-dependent oxidoreductase (luciferase family)
LYGYNLNDYDALFEEKLNLLQQINQQERITWKGRHRAELKNQQVLPRALNGHLPVWVAVGGTPESVVRAARAGLPVIFAIIGGSPEQFKPLFQYYKEMYLHFGHDAAKMQVGVHMHCFFGEDSAATAEEYYPLYAAQMDRVGRSRGWPPYQRSAYDFGRGKHGALIIGEPHESIEKILALQKMFGLTRFAAHMDVGGPSHSALMKSIEIFGTKIAPKVRAAIG